MTAKVIAAIIFLLLLAFFLVIGPHIRYPNDYGYMIEAE